MSNHHQPYFRLDATLSIIEAAVTHTLLIERCEPRPAATRAAAQEHHPPSDHIGVQGGRRKSRDWRAKPVAPSRGDEHTAPVALRRARRGLMRGTVLLLLLLLLLLPLRALPIDQQDVAIGGGSIRLGLWWARRRRHARPPAAGVDRDERAGVVNIRSEVARPIQQRGRHGGERDGQSSRGSGAGAIIDGERRGRGGRH